MKPNKSEIFENFAQIALKEGLISVNPMKKEAADKTDKERQKEIQMLYNVKPNGKEDEESITERAHPDTVVIAPSYDKVNGVVENDMQQSDIMGYIAMKNPDGNYATFKLAHDSFALELSKTAQMLDNKSIDDLRILADSCLEKFADAKNITPEALGAATGLKRFLPKFLAGGAAAGSSLLSPWILGGLGVAGLGAAVFYFANHTHVKNVVSNLAILDEELQDLDNVPYKNELTKVSSGVKAEFVKIKSLLTEARALIQQYKQAEDSQKSLEISEKATNIRESMEDHFDQILAYQADLRDIANEIKASESGQFDEEGSSWDFLNVIKDGLSSIWQSDAEDVRDAVLALDKSLDKFTSSVQATIDGYTNRLKPKAEKIAAEKAKKEEIKKAKDSKKEEKKEMGEEELSEEDKKSLDDMIERGITEIWNN